MTGKTVFNRDGSYTRGQKVDELDVAQTPGAKKPALDLTVNSHPVKQVAAPSAPKPNTFSLSALRASAKKASATVAETTLPSQGVANFKKVDVVEIKPAAVEGPSISSGMPNWSKVKSDQLGELARDLLATSKPVEETPAQEAVPTVVEPVEETTAPVVEESEEVSVVPVSEVSEISVEAEIEEASSEPAIEPVAVITEEFSGEGFKLTALGDFLDQLKITEAQFAKWCMACVKASARAPGFVFSAAFNDAVRFYNYFVSDTPMWCGVVAGCGDYLVVARIQTKSLVVQDLVAKATSDAKCVSVNGDIVVFYEERLHQTRRV